MYDIDVSFLALHVTVYNCMFVALNNCTLLQKVASVMRAQSPPSVFFFLLGKERGAGIRQSHRTSAVLKFASDSPASISQVLELQS